VTQEERFHTVQHGGHESQDDTSQ